MPAQPPAGPQLLYGLATLAEGGTLEDPASFGKLMSEVMVESLEKGWGSGIRIATRFRDRAPTVVGPVRSAFAWAHGLS